MCPSVSTAAEPFVLASNLAAMLAARGRIDLLHAPLDRIIDTFAQCVAGPGFASIRWYGKQYTFAAAQSRIVERLWHAWQAGTPDVHQSRLLEDTDSESQRLVDLFKGHPAWGTLIISTAKGVYRLKDSD